MQSSPANLGKLLEIWGVTLQQAKAKFDKLVQQNIHPHPGPSPGSSRSNMQLVSLNVGGAPKAWTAVDVFSQAFEGCIGRQTQILALQETAFKPSEHAAFKQALHKHGYRTYYTPGKPTPDRWGHLAPRHGVLLAVSAELPQRLLFETPPDQVEDGQLQMVQVSNWTIVNGYFPPRSEAQQQQMATKLLHSLKMNNVGAGGRPWLFVGDVNSHLGESPYELAAEALQASPLTGLQGLPTRWDGTRTIDHFYSNASSLLSNVKALQYKISDHKPLHVQISAPWQEEELRGVLRQRPSWSKPEDVEEKTWEATLAAKWSASHHVAKAPCATWQRHRCGSGVGALQHRAQQHV